MQFRRQCRLSDMFHAFVEAAGTRPSRTWMATAAGVAFSCVASGSSAQAQLGPNPGAGPSYGYQPYNDRNPTGFYHPNGMGYGHYYLTQKYHAPRFRAFRYRKFRGS